MAEDDLQSGFKSDDEKRLVSEKLQHHLPLVLTTLILDYAESAVEQTVPISKCLDEIDQVFKTFSWQIVDASHWKNKDWTIWNVKTRFRLHTSTDSNSPEHCMIHAQLCEVSSRNEIASVVAKFYPEDGWPSTTFPSVSPDSYQRAVTTAQRITDSIRRSAALSSGLEVADFAWLRSVSLYQGQPIHVLIQRDLDEYRKWERPDEQFTKEMKINRKHYRMANTTMPLLRQLQDQVFQDSKGQVVLVHLRGSDRGQGHKLILAKAEFTDQREDGAKLLQAYKLDRQRPSRSCPD